MRPWWSLITPLSSLSKSKVQSSSSKFCHSRLTEMGCQLPAVWQTCHHSWRRLQNLQHQQQTAELVTDVHTPSEAEIEEVSSTDCICRNCTYETNMLILRFIKWQWQWQLWHHTWYQIINVTLKFKLQHATRLVKHSNVNYAFRITQNSRHKLRL